MTRLQLRLLWLCVVAVIVLAGLATTTTVSVSPNYWTTLQAKLTADRAAVAGSPGNESCMEELGVDLWLAGKWTKAMPWLWAARNGYAHHLRSGYDSDFERSTLRLADFCVDDNDFKQAQDIYRQLAKYDMVQEGPDTARLARDYNNIGLCAFLMAQAKKESKEREQLLNSALDQYRQAERIFAKKGLEDQLVGNRQNQALVLRDLGRNDESQRLSDVVQNKMEGWHSALKQVSFEERTDTVTHRSVGLDE